MTDNDNDDDNDHVDADKDDLSPIVQIVLGYDFFPPVPWLESACNWNSDCPSSVTNAECFENRCLCSPGYYYSWSQNDCVASKSSAPL